jgi:glycine/serine hydroxymethyltransferase
MKEKEMEEIVGFMHEALHNPRDAAHLARLEARVRDFCDQFPLFAAEWSFD